MVYLATNPRYQIPHRCLIWRRNPERLHLLGRTSYRSALRHTSRHGPRFDRFCNLRIGVCPSPTGPASIEEPARKPQDTHRWGSSRYQDPHRWGSLHGSSRLVSLGYRAGGTSGCCGGVLTIQLSQVLQSGPSCIDRPIGTSALVLAHFLCSHLHVSYQLTRFQNNAMIATHTSFNM